jgi:hypothetical protein
VTSIQKPDTPFVSCLDDDEIADLKREAALQWHTRNRRCPECGHCGFHMPRCPEGKSDDTEN